MTKSKKLFELTAFYSIESTQAEKPFPILFGSQLLYESLISSNNNQLVRVRETGNLTIISVASIISKCVVLNTYPLFLSILPNLLDRD